MRNVESKRMKITRASVPYLLRDPYLATEALAIELKAKKTLNLQVHRNPYMKLRSLDHA